MSVSIQLPVQWGDQDIFGHVNNVIYFRWLESGRLAYLERMGADLRRVQNLSPIIASASATFLKPVHYPATVEVITRVTKIGKSSINFAQEIRIAGSGELTTRGEAVLVLLDYAANRSVPWSDEMRAVVARIEGWEGIKPSNAV